MSVKFLRLNQNMPENVSDQLADDYINHAVNLQRVTADVRRKTIGYLEELQRELVEKLREIDPTQPALSRFRKERLQKLLDQTRATINTAYVDMRKASDSEIRELVVMEGDFAVKTINNTIKADLVSVKWTPELINSVMSDTLIEGAPSRAWWGR